MGDHGFLPIKQMLGRQGCLLVGWPRAFAVVFTAEGILPQGCKCLADQKLSDAVSQVPDLIRMREHVCYQLNIKPYHCSEQCSLLHVEGVQFSNHDERR